MKHLGKILIAAGTLALGSMGHAAPVTDWAVTTVGTWTAWAPSGVTHNGDTLSWGVPNTPGGQQSSLVITNPGVQNIQTYTGLNPPQVAPYLANSVALTHNNFVLQGGSPTLTSATLSVAMTVQATNTNPVGVLNRCKRSITRSSLSKPRIPPEPAPQPARPVTPATTSSCCSTARCSTKCSTTAALTTT